MPSSPHRKFAVQKPKGRKWETLALVDGLEQGRAEFRQAVAQHGGGYVRLIQVDFKTEDVLSDYDWHLIDLHDPFKGKGPTRPTLVAGKERRQPDPESAAAAAARPARPGPARDPRPAGRAPAPAASVPREWAVREWAGSAGRRPPSSSAARTRRCPCLSPPIWRWRPSAPSPGCSG
ncbi:hypothetical protein [Rhodospirillum centenum]|uniref:Uncharacterized protein n=1 Tax=Rhodospirillum centenum (strain ATCC 51521 / SW) TaxID=414684 RepID=B6IU42_RHOCS|nr:hypothetical protein [Rhodospirillum centenum]ACI99919.1 hypothetical protein RC1_2538 [Rhodospirillum centenum SW]